MPRLESPALQTRTSDRRGYRKCTGSLSIKHCENRRKGERSARALEERRLMELTGLLFERRPASELRNAVTTVYIDAEPSQRRWRET